MKTSKGYHERFIDKENINPQPYISHHQNIDTKTIADPRKIRQPNINFIEQSIPNENRFENTLVIEYSPELNQTNHSISFEECHASENLSAFFLEKNSINYFMSSSSLSEAQIFICTSTKSFAQQKSFSGLTELENNSSISLSLSDFWNKIQKKDLILPQSFLKSFDPFLQFPWLLQKNRRFYVEKKIEDSQSSALSAYPPTKILSNEELKSKSNNISNIHEGEHDMHIEELEIDDIKIQPKFEKIFQQQKQIANDQMFSIKNNEVKNTHQKHIVSYQQAQIEIPESKKTEIIALPRHLAQEGAEKNIRVLSTESLQIDSSLIPVFNSSNITNTKAERSTNEKTVSKAEEINLTDFQKDCDIFEKGIQDRLPSKSTNNFLTENCNRSKHFSGENMIIDNYNFNIIRAMQERIKLLEERCEELNQTNFILNQTLETSKMDTEVLQKNNTFLAQQLIDFEKKQILDGEHLRENSSAEVKKLKKMLHNCMAEKDKMNEENKKLQNTNTSLLEMIDKLQKQYVASQTNLRNIIMALSQKNNPINIAEFDKISLEIQDFSNKGLSPLLNNYSKKMCTNNISTPLNIQDVSPKSTKSPHLKKKLDFYKKDVKAEEEQSSKRMVDLIKNSKNNKFDEVLLKEVIKRVSAYEKKNSPSLSPNSALSTLARQHFGNPAKDCEERLAQLMRDKTPPPRSSSHLSLQNCENSINSKIAQKNKLKNAENTGSGTSLRLDNVELMLRKKLMENIKKYNQQTD